MGGGGGSGDDIDYEFDLFGRNFQVNPLPYKIYSIHIDFLSGP